MMQRLSAVLILVLVVILTGCKTMARDTPDHQIALGHLAAPQLALSPTGKDLIVISFAERQPQQQTMVPLAKFRTTGWTIGSPYGLRTNGEAYWLEPLSENAVAPQPAPTQQPAKPALKPSAPRGGK